MAHRPNLATACVYTAQDPRMIFTLLNNWKKDVKTVLGYLTVSVSINRQMSPFICVLKQQQR